jgi:hypothetical protein
MRSDARSRRNARRNRYGDRLLSTWNEIADFAGRSVRTVQRWEEFYHFPVHRDEHGVHAHPQEVDEWMAQPLIFRSPVDLDANRRWNRDVRTDAKEAVDRSRELRKQAQSERAAAQHWHKRA